MGTNAAVETNTVDGIAVGTLVALIPVWNAGVCIQCDRLFTILPRQETCPGCGSKAWHPVSSWLKPLGRRMAE